MLRVSFNTTQIKIRIFTNQHKLSINYLDPLNATLVSASDDPLFSPTITSNSSKAQSQSSRTNSPIPNDPLSRPTDTSSSTPISPRRATNASKNSSNNSSSPNSSIFGDIDVSKLGTSNGKKHTVRSPALRSKQYDMEDEDDLFGGGHRTRKTSKAPTPASLPPVKKSPTVIHQDIPQPSVSKNVSPMSVPASLPSPIIQQKPQVVQPSKPIIEQPVEQQPAKNETSTKEEKPTVSSSSSSFFRFFKSSNNNSNTNSKNSSSASSIASVNAPSPIVKNNDAVNSTIASPPPPPPPVRQQAPPPPLSSQQHQPIKPEYINNSKSNVAQQQQEEEEEEPEEQHHIIEDEATRAFAEDDVITFKPTLLNYRSISPELTMDALKIDTPTISTNITKKLVPSISTPTNNVEDPWSNPLLIQPIVEPSISSPLVVKVQDIEPQKRTAFADLINSWNTGKSNNKEYTRNQDPKEFFDHVAAERRDIGFAGIREQDEEEDDDDEEQEHYHRQQLDYHDEINPWN